MSSLANQLRRMDERRRVAELEHAWAWRPDAFLVGVTYGRRVMTARRQARLEARHNRGHKLRGDRRPAQPEAAPVVHMAERRSLRDRARGLFKRAMRRVA